MAASYISTRVILIRHGETEWNREGRMQGHLDSPLTEQGRKQAEEVAERLADLPIKAIYSSDLGRAVKTAQALARRIGLSILPEPRVRERNLGVFQGLTEPEVTERYPDEWQRFLTRDPDYRMPGGESSRDRVVRSAPVLDELGERHAGEVVVLVTHGGILDGLFRLVTGIPLEAPRKFKIWNGGINILSRSSVAEDEAQDTGGLSSGGPAGSGNGWMVDVWGYTGRIVV